jgi:hypothetical protein
MEAQRYPKTFISNVNPRKFDQNRTASFLPSQFAPPPAGLEISSVWEADFLQYFHTLQKVTTVTLSPLRIVRT